MAPRLPQVTVPLVIAALCLASTYGLARAGRFRALPRVLGIVTGICVGWLAIGAAENALGLVPDSPAFRNLAHVVRALQQAPPTSMRVLLVGSSHTEQGVDAGLLQQQLRARGIDVTVAQLSLGGMTLLEQDYLLEQLIERFDVVPDLILFEVSRYWDVVQPLGDLATNHAEARFIDHRDFARALLGAQIEFERTGLGTSVLASWRDLFNSAVLHELRIARLARLVRLDALPGYAGFREGASAVQQGFTPPAASGQWSFVVPRERFQSKEFSRTDAVDDFRVKQWQWLVRESRLLVGYFAPPSLIEVDLEYAKSYCRVVSGPCIVYDDPDLLDSFATDDWWNEVHLLPTGAEKYSVWLAERLARLVLAP